MILNNSSHVLIEGNEIINIDDNGIELNMGNNNIITGNYVENAKNNGIKLWKTCKNNVIKNEVAGCTIGVLIFSYSDYNNISFNNAFSNA